MSENSLIVAQQGQVSVMPAMSIRDAVDRHRQMVGFVREIMHEGSDYGVVPGTSTKPVLFKPGAEKLTTFFGLVPRFVVVERTEDWGDGEREPLFYYWFKCELYRNGQIVGEADGSCSSRESKYRYRKAGRVCPGCGSDAIIKGRTEYGGGWLCYGKKGGCGAKFKDGDKAIEGQSVGRVLNEDVADLANTILKMAQKRALVAATLITVNASEFFTQDIEDMDYSSVINGSFVAKPSMNGKAAHWFDGKTRNGKAVSAMFWAWATGELGLSEAEVHTALEVEHIRDYAGDMGQAKAKIVDWVGRQIDADKKEPESAS